ncbi:MAG: N-6 DNA methylase [Deltaproteobacteria bacterium]|nr:N-6 DNA methylase [Deltaproteobacteria bacterium]
MITFAGLLNKLDYNTSQYYKKTASYLSETDPEIAPLLRNAHNAEIKGIYFFETTSQNKISKPNPAVYITKAPDESEANVIHKKVWNIGQSPFLIINIPTKILVYTGFDYSKKKNGLLDEITRLKDLNRLLINFKADFINAGYVWKRDYAKKIDVEKRVDKRLLENLEELDKILTKENGLDKKVSHALIGKYIYLKYLRGRKILTDTWIQKQGINPGKVFDINANLAGFKSLIKALEKKLNGKIFPIDFDNSNIKEEHIKLIARVFKGKNLQNKQLPLFDIYDFEHIPIETLSSIYEQFISGKKTKGAVYTPEFLANYMISEMESEKPLETGMKILDPACGSGIFLVLIYKRLIEKKINSLKRELKFNELKKILEQSVYGVEKETEACFITEFSLLLTMLNYLDPRDLESLNFRFPALHNFRIFNADFFDINAEESETNFWEKGLKFDWIAGNPPWIRLNQDKKKQKNKSIYSWMENNKKDMPVENYQTAEAFSWLVADLLEDNGIIGLVMPVTSLVNSTAKDYRKKFFSANEVLRVANFGNIKTIFKSGLSPATIIYRKNSENKYKRNILHYGPFRINQLFKANKISWTIIINENEIKEVSADEAEKGKTSFWKLALWGTYLDKRNLERIEHLFPLSLDEFIKKNNWHCGRSIELQDKNKESKYKPILKKELIGYKKLDAKLMNKSLLYFSLDEETVFKKDIITEKNCYIRKR